MISGVQISALIFLVLMMYLTFVNYKRKSYGYQSLLLWMSVWLAAMILVIVPQTVYGIMETLEIQRTADFFTLVGFAFIMMLIFYMYSVVKSSSYKVEQLVRQLAMRDAELEEKKSKKKQK